MSSFSTGLYGSTIGSIVGNVNNAFSGKTSGIDVSSIVNQLMQIERQPEAQIQQQQSLINSKISALNSLSTQLTALYNSVNDLRDLQGAFSQKSTGSTDAAIVSASADTTAVGGTHSVTVSKLATISSSYSDYIPTGTSLAGAQITVKYGSDPENPLKSDTIDIPETATTLQLAASAINSGEYGVSASVVTDSHGARLVLVSKASGADGNLTVSSAAANFTNAPGVDAQLTVDGVPVVSSTNIVTGAIPGVTLSLGAADPDTAVLISVQPDTSQASQALQNFVDAYNAAIKAINAEYTMNPTTGSEGVLAGDSMLRTLQSNLLSMAATEAKNVGQYVNLQSMGIEMQNDGTLQINSAKLSNAMSSNFADVQKFFQSIAPAGWGQNAGMLLLKLTSPTLGPVGVDITGLNQTNRNLTDQINDLEVRMDAVQRQLTAQYSALNTLLQQYPLQMQQIASQLANLPGMSGSNKG